MQAVFSTIQVVICVVLVLLILMHSGKDSGLSGAFGVGTGAGPLGGGSLVERNLNRWTIFFAILFVGNTILLLKHPGAGAADAALRRQPLPRRWLGLGGVVWWGRGWGAGACAGCTVRRRRGVGGT